TSALVPASPWLAGRAPSAPIAALSTDASSRSVVCIAAAARDTAAHAPKWWIVRVKRGADWTTEILPGVVHRWAMGMTARADSVVVSGVDRTGREGAPTVVTARGC